MSGGIIFIITLALLLALTVVIIFIKVGINLCKRNNATGVILLFIALNILGFVIGWSVLYNAKNGMYLKEIENLDKWKNENLQNKLIENKENPK